MQDPQNRAAGSDMSLAPERLRPVMQALCAVAADLARTIAQGPLARTALGAEVGQNSDGDGQKALDVMADEAFARALAPLAVRWFASEERAEVIGLNPRGDLALAIDPLDGSSNIDVNVSIGTIFSLFDAKDDPDDSFLRPAREQLAGGYFIYGPQTCLVVTYGRGTHLYVLDPGSGLFELAKTRVQVPASSCEFAINASNYRHWSKPIRAFIDDCLAGTDGPQAENFNMRWVASLVAETHRILTRGGLFLYPGDGRPGYENGRLRMVYECAPIAFVIAQAGGGATDGFDPILDRTAPALHTRTPLIFGSCTMVDRLTAYNDLPEREVSALFGNRGLFRA